jgi:hypothetical protein
MQHGLGASAKFNPLPYKTYAGLPRKKAHARRRYTGGALSLQFLLGKVADANPLASAGIIAPETP